MKENIKSKPSIFNRYINIDNTNLVFNSVSCSLIRLDQEKLEALKSGNYLLFSDEEKEKLTRMNFINSLEDERKFIIDQRFQAVTSKDTFMITVFTTTHCNANCEYCFENGVERTKPSEEVENQIINLLLANKEKKIHVKWFGGEPLLNTPMIDRISSVLSKEKVEFSSSMITNGYLIGCFINKLHNWHLKNVQITLDGINEKYNNAKKYNNHNDSNPFATVISGIKLLLKEKIKVSIRLNFDKHNYLDIIECINYLHTEIGNPDNFTIYAHHIFGPKESYHLDDGTNIYLLISKELIKCGYVHSLFRLGVRYRPLPCSAYSPSFYAIDPKGTLMKCEHFKLDPDYPGFVGNLKDGITNHKNEQFWLDRNYPYKKCVDCEFLPLCEGGCRFETLQNYPDGACLPYKDCIDEMLYAYYCSKNNFDKTIK